MRSPKKADILKSVLLFSNLNKRQLAQVAKVAYTYPLPIAAGKELVRQGDPGRELLILLRGSARVIRNGRTVRKLVKGDHFGEISLIDQRPRSASVVAESEVEIMGLSSKSFMTLLDGVPGLAKKTVLALCDYLREAQGAPGKR